LFDILIYPELLTCCEQICEFNKLIVKPYYFEKNIFKFYAVYF